MKQKIRTFLGKYCPAMLPVAHACLHAFRLAPYKIPAQRQNFVNPANKAYIESVTQAALRQTPPTLNLNYHIVLYTHALNSGGAERQWCYLAKELSRRGYAVTLLTESIHGERGHYLPLLDGANVRVLAMDTLRIPQSVTKKLSKDSMPFNVYCCLAAFALLKPTHVLGQLDGGNLWGGAAALLSGCNIERTLISFRNVNPSHFPHNYHAWMMPNYRALLPSNKIVLSSNSRFAGDDCAKWLGVPSERIICIHNALEIPPEDESARARVRSKFFIDDDELVVLGVFRLSPEKNPMLFLNVAAALRQEFPHLVILHAGEGPMLAELQKEAQQLGLEGALKFLGRQSDVLSLMRASDMLLLTSDFEGLPNVMLEAQSVSLPIVATKVGGTPEAADENQSAFLVERGNLKKLVQQCIRLLQDKKLRIQMGEKGREFILKGFSHKALADGTLDAIGLPNYPDRPSFHIPEQLPVSGTPCGQVNVQSELDVFFATRKERTVVIFSQPPQWFPVVAENIRTIQFCTQKANLPNGAIYFNWACNADWSPIKEYIPDNAIAYIAGNLGSNIDARGELRKLGIQHVILMHNCSLYCIQTAPHSLWKIIFLAIKSILDSFHTDK